jgi:ATP-dependent Zn protease
MRHGMVEALGHVAYEDPPPRFLELPPGMEGPAARRHGARTRQRIDDAVQAIVGEGFAQARALLGDRLATLERGAAQLLLHETLDEAALKQLVAGAGSPDAKPSAAAPPMPPAASRRPQPAPSSQAFSPTR